MYSVSSSISDVSSSSKANFPPDQFEVIDNGLVFTRPDNTTYSPGSDEAYFTSLSVSVMDRAGGTWNFYYRTTPTGAWLPAGTPNAAGKLTLPAGAVGWRVVVDKPTVLLPQVLVYAYATLVQRPTESPIKFIDNTTSNSATYSNGSSINSSTTYWSPASNQLGMEEL